MIIGRLWALLTCAIVAAATPATATEFISRSQVERAISDEKIASAPPGVTGIIVPHHPLAARLIARGFWAASAARPKRVIILCPDHLQATLFHAGVTSRSFTVLGREVQSDAAAAAMLRTKGGAVEHPRPEAEHGLMVVLPFVETFFPDARIVPVIMSTSMRRPALDRLIAALKPLAGPNTLIVQSTDFSHYSSGPDAARLDQETLNVIASGDPEAVLALRNVDHLDSKAAQYLQMRLQREVYGATTAILANANSDEFGPESKSTTSYVVQAYAKDASALGGLTYADQSITFFGGDFFPARLSGPLMTHASAAQAVTSYVQKLTRGAPLFLNLEGVLSDGPIIGAPEGRHGIEAAVALPLMSAMNVKGVSLANNHAYDFGRQSLTDAQALLATEGRAALSLGQTARMSGISIVALNFVPNASYGDYPVAGDAEIQALCRSNIKPPVFAFVHWGSEFTKTPGPREQALAERLYDCGVAAVIGAHSHMASDRVLAPRGGGGALVYSLGNFLFDQETRGASGALLEVRVFRQGTFALRLIPIDNLFTLARRTLAAQEKPGKIE